jgi:hypothetical protein
VRPTLAEAKNVLDFEELDHADESIRLMKRQNAFHNSIFVKFVNAAVQVARGHGLGTC